MKEKNEDEFVKLTIRVPKFMKDKMKKVVEKSSYNTLAELVRAGIDKELDLQMNKENLDFIIKELDKLIDKKLDPFIKSQRKLNVNYARTAAINTYMLGEVFSKMLGDEFHEEFIKILSGARKKANYYVIRTQQI